MAKRRRRGWRTVGDALDGPPTPRPRSVDRMLRFAFGVGSTRSGRIDTRAAAEALGVSRRTMQRWMQQGVPSARRSAAAKRLETAVEARHQAMQADRRARRRNALVSGVTRMAISGTFSISSDTRERHIQDIEMRPEQMEAIFSGWDEGGEEGARDALSDAIQESYADGLELDDLDELDWW